MDSILLLDILNIDLEDCKISTLPMVFMCLPEPGYHLLCSTRVGHTKLKGSTKCQKFFSLLSAQAARCLRTSPTTIDQIIDIIVNY